VLGSVVAAWISTASLALTGLLYRRSARRHLAEPEAIDPHAAAEMRRYVTPIIPGVIFNALQAQVQVAVITVLGQSKSIAEVAALGRLGQLFLLLHAFNGVFVQPFISRTGDTDLPRRYARVLLSQTAIAGALTCVAFAVPETLLWILGPNYSGLSDEVGWVTLAACIGYVSAGMWTMHSARRWIYWWGTIGYISSVLIAQVLSALFLDLSRTHGVVLFGLITNVAVLLLHVATAVYGFRRGAPAALQARDVRPDLGS
jgi:hypothetical protein